MGKDDPATEKQYRLLGQLKYNVDREMTSGEASDLIAQLLSKPKDITKNYSQGGVSPENNQAITSFPHLDKDRLIVRQSCLKAAVEMTNVCWNIMLVKGTTGVSTMTLDILRQSVIKEAEEFEKWVFR